MAAQIDGRHERVFELGHPFLDEARNLTIGRPDAKRPGAQHASDAQAKRGGGAEHEQCGVAGLHEPLGRGGGKQDGGRQQQGAARGAQRRPTVSQRRRTACSRLSRSNERLHDERRHEQHQPKAPVVLLPFGLARQPFDARLRAGGCDDQPGGPTRWLTPAAPDPRYSP